MLKFTVFVAIYRWLKPRWRGLLILAGVILLTNVLHGEFLTYVALTDDRQFLLASYIFKWTILILVLPVYILSTGLSSHEKAAERKNTAPVDTAALDNAPGDDGFDFLRQKHGLQSPAEKLVDKK